MSNMTSQQQGQTTPAQQQGSQPAQGQQQQQAQTPRFTDWASI